jgi:hypothetical protein
MNDDDVRTAPLVQCPHCFSPVRVDEAFRAAVAVPAPKIKLGCGCLVPTLEMAKRLRAADGNL